MTDDRDPELSRLLATWRGREVPADFNAGVWRAVAGRRPRRATAWQRWAEGLWATAAPGPSPLAVAASLMLAVGVGVAVAAAAPTGPGPAATPGHYDLQGPHTLAGAYARLLEGEAR